ncbi:hypothetical protein P5673_033325 [Acropora cervicornis]|uniref:Uncharacterized protein n=1 Tax=Acropora cervicornis TaxID=6130 RepID=A0AAD9PQC1_ACRCE|nr:hypothetical protein P5673_033325 [Acropora cervicornis]
MIRRSSANVSMSIAKPFQLLSFTGPFLFARRETTNGNESALHKNISFSAFP